jgi:hypothetical protein
MAQQGTSVRWDPLKIFLVVAAVFAIGSVGFFLAVFMGNANSAPATPEQISATIEEQHEAAMQSLAQSEAQQSATTSFAGSTSTLPTVMPNQADPSEPDAAEKLKVLESLNGGSQ